MFAEARFRTPWADDEFTATIATARQWLGDHPCPDGSLGQHFVEMLGAYAEMTSANVARVMELRVDVDEHVKALDRWRTQTMRKVDSSTPEREVQVRCERRETVTVPDRGGAS